MLNTNETQLYYLFGDAMQAIDFYLTTPHATKEVVFVEDTMLSQVIDMEKEICLHCKNTKMFENCRHITKRIIGECDGAISELTWHEILVTKG
jgi:hypothetical protein